MINNDENEGITLISYEILDKNSIKCDDCGETIKNYSVIHCGNCVEDLFNSECLFESLKFVASDNVYLWDDEEYYNGFKTKEDKLLFMKRAMTDAEALADYQRDMEDDGNLYFGKSPYLTKISAESCRKRKESKYEIVILPTTYQIGDNWLRNWIDLIAMIICLLLTGIGIFNIIRYFLG